MILLRVSSAICSLQKGHWLPQKLPSHTYCGATFTYQSLGLVGSGIYHRTRGRENFNNVCIVRSFSAHPANKSTIAVSSSNAYMFLGADGQAVERPRGFAVLAEIVVQFFGPSKGPFREKLKNTIGLCVHFPTARHWLGL